MTRLCWCFFFFSSRRRHTRFDCDWSSDVCSSDLAELRGGEQARQDDEHEQPQARVHHLAPADPRSEEHTSELQSQSNLVCRLLLEKKKTSVLPTLMLRGHAPVWLPCGDVLLARPA